MTTNDRAGLSRRPDHCDRRMSAGGLRQTRRRLLLLTALCVLCSGRLLFAAAGRARPGSTVHQGSSRTGSASQGYLGIDIRDVSVDRASALKLKSVTGAEIIHVDHDGPAGKAGLRVQDVVLAMNGQGITSEAQLRRLLRETPAGGDVTLILSRDGEQQTVRTQLADRATVERQAWLQHMAPPGASGYPAASSSAPRTSFGEGSDLPAASNRGHGNSFLGSGAAPEITAPADTRTHSLLGGLLLGSSYTGAMLETIGPQLLQFFGSTGRTGLLVRSVDPDSPAAIAGLRAGDLLLRANSVALTSPAAWSRLVRESRGKELAIVVLREHQQQTLRLVPDGKRRSSLEAPPQDPRHPGSAATDARMIPACVRSSSFVHCTMEPAHFA